jgi:hypothetical protein
VISEDGISGPYYTPLVIAAILYALLNVGAAFFRSRDAERAATLQDLSFGIVLLSGAYVAVMLITALAQKSDLVLDMIKVLAIMIVFFGLLLVIMLLVFERGIGRLSRLRRR